LNLPTGFQIGMALGELRIYDDLLEMMKRSKAGQLLPPNARGKVVLSKRIPLVERDFAFILKTPFKSSEIERALRKAVGPQLLDMKCVDVYPLSESEVSVAYRIVLQGDEKTLEDALIQRLCTAAIDVAVEKFGAKLRA